MISHKIRSWIAFIIGFIFLGFGAILIVTGDGVQEKFGFIFFGLGGIFWGIMASIQLGAQSTKEITKNVIDTLKLEGLISPAIHIDDNLQVFKRVSHAFTISGKTVKPPRKTAI